MARRRRRHQKQSRLASYIRILISLVYLSLAVIQLIFFLSNGGEVYRFYAVHSLFGVYRSFFDNVVLSHPDFFTILLIIIEIGISILVLNKEMWVKAGLVIGGIFCVLLSPMSREFLPYFLLFALLQILLLSKTYRKNAFT